MNQGKIIFIVGPTGVGKTELVFLLARRLSSEIISCDAMQVYRGLDIVTAKPPAEMLAAVPHHIVNICDVEDEFNVAAFNALARSAVEKVLARNKTVLISGGSGLYMQVLLDGLFADGAPDAGIRRGLLRRLDSEGPQALYAELEGVDPEAAAKIHPRDVRRVVRALEVWQVAQKPMSAIKKERNGLWGQYDITLFALNREREGLYRQIDARVDAMFAQGAVEEIRALQPRCFSLTAGRVIGVREILGYINGAYDQEHAKYLMKRNTRHYAKRQLTWFRKEQRLQWLNIPEGTPAESLLTTLRGCLEAGEKGSG